MRALELKIPPVAFGLSLGALMWIVARGVPTLDFTPPARRVLALSLAIAGVIIAIMGVISFRRAKTTVNPLKPDAASALVVSGIYRATRNPMYLGMLLVLLGWGLFLGNALTFPVAIVFIPLMNRLQIVPEERALTAMFGPAFRTYQSTVRRWL